MLHPPPYQPPDLIAAVEPSNATSLFLVPTTLRRLLDGKRRRSRAGAEASLLISSGAPLTPAERRDIRQRLCEIPGVLRLDRRRRHNPAAPEDDAYTRLGRPADIRGRRRSRRRRRPVMPPGAIGRLRYRGPGVAEGYAATTKPHARRSATAGIIPGPRAQTERGYISCAAAPRT